MIRLIKRLLVRVCQIPTLLTISALLTLVGLALMVWSLLQPTPMPVILAMSVGQVLGILAFALFGVAVLIDQVRKQRARGAAEAAEAANAANELLASSAALANGDGRASSVRPGSSTGSSVSSTREAPR
ncbi:MAG TPA: hypothetical protein VFK02_20840 [Kofleriaceae bacterium]|nr:hypothetical protein [Kofleriaceae bacterium]